MQVSPETTVAHFKYFSICRLTYSVVRPATLVPVVKGCLCESYACGRRELLREPYASLV